MNGSIATFAAVFAVLWAPDDDLDTDQEGCR